MISARLVRMIEDHAEQLTRGVIEDLQRNPRVPAYHELSREELHLRAHKVYRNLGQFLSRKADESVESDYYDLARRRYAEGVALSEVVYALILEKGHLEEYIRTAGLVDSAVELYQEKELYHLVNQFFEKAIYFTIKGYESEATTHQQRLAAASSR